MKAVKTIGALVLSVLGLACLVGSFSLGPNTWGQRLAYWMVGILLLFISHIIERKEPS